MAKKRGRPKKLKSERLDAAMRIRLSASELKAIQKAAGAADLSASEWARLQLQRATSQDNV